MKPLSHCPLCKKPAQTDSSIFNESCCSMGFRQSTHREEVGIVGFNISYRFRLVIDFELKSTIVYEKVDDIDFPRNKFVFSIPYVVPIDFNNLDLPSLREKVKIWLTFS